MAVVFPQVLVYPGAFNMTTGPAHYQILARGRAVDTQSYVPWPLASEGGALQLGLLVYDSWWFIDVNTRPREFMWIIGKCHDITKPIQTP